MSKFLDSVGLTYFWTKIKSMFVSTKEESTIVLPDNNSQTEINFSTHGVTVSEVGSDDGHTKSETIVSPFDITSPKIIKTGGSSTQVLMANGDVKVLGAKNGIPSLDGNGNIPLSQLGNLDTTVAEVVTSLPTSNIKKHIYLVKASSTATNNIYKEYVYTGDVSATYDSSKWEQLGEFKADIDLSPYAKKNEVISGVKWEIRSSDLWLVEKYPSGNTGGDIVPSATTTAAGTMSASDKSKLDGISAGANNYSLPTASASTKGGVTLGYSANGKNYPLVLDGNGKAYVNVPWTDTNTTYDLSPYAKKTDAIGTVSFGAQENAVNCLLYVISESRYPSKTVEIPAATTTTAGVMTKADKVKLNGIATGANNYTHPSTHPASMITGLATVATSGKYSDLSGKPDIGTITTAEIDAMF